jgi:hypothetical protein
VIKEGERRGADIGIVEVIKDQIYYAMARRKHRLLMATTWIR